MVLPQSMLSRVRLSVYGYGAMSFSTALSSLVALLALRYFVPTAMQDMLLGWGVVFYAAASGALGSAISKAYFPHYRADQQLFIACAFSIFLLGCYYSAFQGYAQMVTMIQAPVAVDDIAIQDFWHLLGLAWVGFVIGAAICAVTYLIIYLIFGDEMPGRRMTPSQR